MPLHKGHSKRVISENISILRHEGYPERQAIAIAEHAAHAKKQHSEKLVITGTPQYIEHMAKHLKKEHPTTRHRLKVIK